MIFYLVVMFAHGEVLMPNFYYDVEVCNNAALHVLADNKKRVYDAYCIQFDQTGSFVRGQLIPK